MSSHDIMRPVPVPAPVTVGVAFLRGGPRRNNHRQPGDCSFDIPVPVPVCPLYELMNRVAGASQSVKLKQFPNEIEQRTLFTLSLSRTLQFAHPTGLDGLDFLRNCENILLNYSLLVSRLQRTTPTLSAVQQTVSA